MRWVFFGVIVVHGLIHFMGAAKAYGLGESPQLTPISPALGIAWLAGGLGVLAAAVLFLVAPRVWWMVGLGAVLLSQLAIVSAWTDARYGTVANVLLLAGVVYGVASHGPPSFRAEYERGVRAHVAPSPSPGIVTEADLARLPDPVQRYLRLTGAVGQPRVHHVRARWRGRIRSTADDPWMAFTAEQVSFPGEPARFFRMDATRRGLPVDVFHAFQGQSATMRVRLLSLVPLVDARGPELDRAETVTLFNDLCLLTPAALIDAPVRWEFIDPSTVRGHYTVGIHTISAVLSFNAAGELVDFVSDDRLVMSRDGTTLTPQRRSTPVKDYRTWGRWHLFSRGEGRWHPPEGAFAYLDLELIALETNGTLPLVGQEPGAGGDSPARVLQRHNRTSQLEEMSRPDHGRTGA